MSENLKTIISILFIFGAVAALLTWKFGTDFSVDDSAISEIQDDLSAFERMKADVAKDNPIQRDIIADIASSSDIHRPTSTNDKADNSQDNTLNKNDVDCTDMDYIYGKKGCKAVSATDSTGADTGTDKASSIYSSDSNRTDSSLSFSSNNSSYKTADDIQKKEEKPHPFLIWKEINQSKPDKITGKSSVYPGEVIRAGCLVLAELENEIIAIPGREHLVVINVRGALDGCKLPKTSGIRLVGRAKQTQDGRYIEARIDTCSDRSQNRKSVPCTGKAQVLSITGSELLEGWVYDESGMGLLWESIIAVGMTPAVAKLTQTAATAKTIFTAQTAGEISGTLTKTLDRISQKISAAFDGREIRITPKPGKPVTIQVLFSKDVIL